MWIRQFLSNLPVHFYLPRAHLLRRRRRFALCVGQISSIVHVYIMAQNLQG